MTQLNFKIETPSLSDFQEREIPYVLARTNSKLAADVAFRIRDEIPSKFKGKTRFVQSGMLYERGGKADPRARVINRDPHMWTHEGGQKIDRSAKGRKLLEPSDHYRKYYKRDSPSELLRNREFFRTEDGIFKRRGRDKNGDDHSTAYFWSSDSHRYQDRLQVRETAEEVVNEKAQRYFDDYLQQAVATSKKS